MSQSTPHTAVIVGEHPLWMDALQNLLERLDLQVVGRTTDLGAARRIVADHRPDLLVLDYSAIATDDTLDAALLDCARRVNPDVHCVVLSEHDDPREREHAFEAGASVFCVKRAQSDDLTVAIRQIFDRSIYFATGGRTTMADPTPLALRSGAVGLTKRELEILRLAAEGHSNSQRAATLWVTEQTVKFHLSNIYRKLNVSNRTEASRWAQVNGLLDVRTAA
jgi:DNA-binding NarL/FixJ family response regulator